MIKENENRRPTAADEARLWDLLESAWTACGPEAAAARRELMEHDPADDEIALDAFLEQFLTELRGLSANLSSQELTDLDRVVERKLYDLDREDIHEETDGSDDGFLYCRGFIVAAGRDFFDVVNADPTKAVLDAECEEMCYFFAQVHKELFDAYPETASGISRETGSNAAGW